MGSRQTASAHPRGPPAPPPRTRRRPAHPQRGGWGPSPSTARTALARPSQPCQRRRRASRRAGVAPCRPRRPRQVPGLLVCDAQPLACSSTCPRTSAIPLAKRERSAAACCSAFISRRSRSGTCSATGRSTSISGPITAPTICPRSPPRLAFTRPVTGGRRRRTRCQGDPRPARQRRHAAGGVAVPVADQRTDCAADARAGQSKAAEGPPLRSVHETAVSQPTSARPPIPAPRDCLAVAEPVTASMIS